MSNVTKRYLQLNNFSTVRLKRIPNAHEENECENNEIVGTNIVILDNQSPKKPAAQKQHKKTHLNWVFFEPMGTNEDNSASPNKSLRK